MTLYRATSDGDVAMTAEEEAAVLAERAADAARISIPDEVPMASARIILLRAGITAAMVTNAINADVTTTSAQKAEALIDFEFRTTVRRNSALTLALGPALGLTPIQMDTMFIQAAAL